jgi:FAD/FMN-containing dehydrogenase
LRTLVLRAADRDQRVRAVGAGHSSSPLVATEHTLISLKRFARLESFDKARQIATIGAGMTLDQAGSALHDIGLAMPNLGDIDQQTVAGAIATGTHGSGKELQNLATMLIGGRLVDGRGQLVDIDEDSDGEVIRAARCSLGLLGVFSSLRLRLVPAYRLIRRELWARTDDVLAELGLLIDRNRNFDFYWYPRSDAAKLRVMNEDGGAGFVIDGAKLAESSEGWSHEVLSKTRTLKFDEVEYALPRESGPECFQKLRALTKLKHRKQVAWRMLYRTVAKDDAYLSPAHERATATISVHHNAGLPFEDYFADAERIFREFDGRPHWGKKHTADATQIMKAYPRRERFLAIRDRFDPARVFANSHLETTLSIAS